MAEQQRHGRFYAQELRIAPDVNIREQIQDALDAGERLEWNLLGVSDVLPERCKKTPEETAQDAQNRQNAEKANEKDERDMNGVPAGYKRNAGPTGVATATEEQADSADQNYDHTQDDLTSGQRSLMGSSWY